MRQTIKDNVLPSIASLCAILLVGCSNTASHKPLSSACQLSHETGPCRAAFTKYYFDEVAQTCRAFTWGGCDGVVPFDTKEECEQQCVTGDSATLQQQYLENSRLKWLEKKQAAGGNYSYKSSFASWVGFGSETVLTVEQDTVIKRQYKAWDQQRTTTAQWTEERSQLGQHKVGAALSTVDQLYQQCADILATRSSTSTNLSIGYGDDGLLNYCLVSDKNCADDCASGVRIDAINFLSSTSE